MITCKVYTQPDVSVVDVRNIDLAADVIIWSRGGEKRLIPKAMALDAARLLMDGEKMVAAGRLPVLPPEWYSIHWECCRPATTPTRITVNGS